MVFLLCVCVCVCVCVSEQLCVYGVWFSICNEMEDCVECGLERKKVETLLRARGQRLGGAHYSDVLCL